MLDGVLTINELVDLAQKKRKECIILKVDFEKAYDSVDWDYLQYMTRRMGFCDKWMGQMDACVFSGQVSVHVNGSPIEEFKLRKGLRQGDPVAKFLFLIVAEGLSSLMTRAVDSEYFYGFDVDQSCSLCHLQFDDDTFLMGKASSDNLWALKAVLIGVELVSGLKVNFHKSCIYSLNVSDNFLLAV